jgi:hypothetical protein
MKGEKLLSLAIVLSMLLAVLLPIAAVKAQPTTVEVFFENGLHEITKAPCNIFTVTIKIFEAPPMDFWDMEIHWDPAVLELQHGTIADVVEGAFMNHFGATIFTLQNPDNATGILPDIACGFLSGGPASGTGILMTIAFHAKATGDSAITIWLPGVESYLLFSGPPSVSYPFAAVNGIVHVPPPPPTPPKAIITTPADGAQVPVCNDVLLDGSLSTAGFDTLPPPGETCPINDWKWEVNFHNGTIAELHDAHQSFHCDGPGLVTITLTVTAPDPTPPSAPGFVPTDSETIEILQVAPSLGPAIDVYTERGGTGIFVVATDGPYPYHWSDAYGPQEEVIVYAKVTYNDEPVEYKPVIFEVVDPLGAGRDFRTAFTGAGGIATTSFRIPWQGSGAESMFGNWSIVGVVSISEQIVSDIVKFKFGYILSIRGITVDPMSLHKGETMTIDVDIASISMTPHYTVLTITACDECGVPIGLAYALFTVDPEDGISAGQTITIPPWAYVGMGTIYVNLLTNWPQYSGVPYCPEETTPFIVLKTP